MFKITLIILKNNLKKFSSKFSRCVYRQFVNFSYNYFWVLCKSHVFISLLLNKIVAFVDLLKLLTSKKMIAMYCITLLQTHRQMYIQFLNNNLLIFNA